MPKTSTIYIADTHIGHRMGLLPPTVTIGDGFIGKPPTYSRKVYKYFLNVTNEIKEFTKGTRRLLFLVGDVVDFDAKNRTDQYLTRSGVEVVGIAHETLAPLYEWVDGVIVLRGTDAHTGKDGQLEEMFARELDHAIPDDVHDRASWAHCARSIEGWKVDVAHATSMGSRAWTFANAANYLAADTFMEYTLRGEKPPDIVIRAHVHRSADSGDNYPTRGLTLPCWKLIDTYGSNRKPARYPDFGAFVQVIENGEVIKEHKWKQTTSQYSRHTWNRRL